MLCKHKDTHSESPIAGAPLSGFTMLSCAQVLGSRAAVTERVGAGMASDPQLPYNRVWGGAPVQGHNHVTVAFIKQRTSIRVIDHTHDEQGTTKRTAFWRALEQGGWDIALSEHPCVMKPLKHKKTQDAFRPEIECKGFFTKSFWDRATADPTGLAIAISHARAWHEMAAGFADQEGWMIVIEKDVVFTTNSYLQIMWVIRELFRNPAYGATKLVNLVVSQDRLYHMTRIVRAAEEAAPPSAHDYYYQMFDVLLQQVETPVRVHTAAAAAMAYCSCTHTQTTHATMPTPANTSA